MGASLNNFAEKPFTQLIHLAYQILLQPAQSESLLGELHSISEEAGVSIGVCKHLLKALLAYLRAGAKKGLTAPLLQQQLTTMGVEGPKVSLLTEEWVRNYTKMCRTMLSQV